MAKYLLLTGCILFFLNTNYAQDSISLNIGDKAPALVLKISQDEVQSLNFPKENKIVLLFFWTSSVASSKANLFKYVKLAKRYSSADYKDCDGFEAISVALQSDKLSWEKDVKKYNLNQVSSYIALKGYRDQYIKSYKLVQTPTSFLIDEFGKIIYINPDIRTIMDYLDQRKNTLSGEPQKEISGKILVGDDVLKPLPNQKIYLTNDKNDTLKIVTTNEMGVFYANNLNTLQDININVETTTKIKENDKVYSASENGDILSDFNKTSTGFKYRLLDIEMAYLKPLPETNTESKNSKELKELYFSENLHKEGGKSLSKSAKLKLDILVNKLNANPNCRVEIISHTDCVGDSSQNMNLSIKRATVIADYFISKGIDKMRVKAIGKGESEPLNKCIDNAPCSEEEHEINRRTNFRFYQIE